MGVGESESYETSGDGVWIGGGRCFADDCWGSVSLTELGISGMLGRDLLFFRLGDGGHAFGDAGEVVDLGVCAFLFGDLGARREHGFAERGLLRLTVLKFKFFRFASLARVSM